jgi:hypothetical protein
MWLAEKLDWKGLRKIFGPVNIDMYGEYEITWRLIN